MENGRARRLNWQMPGEALAGIDDEREQLNGEIPAEKSAESEASRVAEHPVDDANPDHRRTGAAGNGGASVWQGQPGNREDRRGENQQR